MSHVHFFLKTCLRMLLYREIDELYITEITPRISYYSFILIEYTWNYPNKEFPYLI